MKKFTAILLLLVLLAGCTDRQKLSLLEEQKTQLETEYKLLQEESALKDQYISEYTSTINEVFGNLETIRKREGFVLELARDIENQENATMKQRMLAGINSIDVYLKKSKKKLKALKSRNYALGVQVDALQETVEQLTRTVEEKERQINELRAQVEELSVKVARAETQIQDKEEIIAQQTEELQKLHTAYYIIAPESELKKKGIVIEEGGFLGLRKSKKLAANFSNEDFISTDILTTNAIQIGTEIGDVRLISPHSMSSFQLVEQEDGQARLEIVNPQEFWKMKYLVIMTKG